MNENESHKTLTTQSILWLQRGEERNENSVDFICCPEPAFETYATELAKRFPQSK